MFLTATQLQPNYIKPVGVDVHDDPRSYGSPPHIRLLLKSVIYRSLLLWEKVPRNEADEVFEA